MPIYSYACTSGHTFDQLTKMDLSDAPQTCPFLNEALSRELRVDTVCGTPLVRTVTLNAKSFPGADSWRK